MQVTQLRFESVVGLTNREKLFFGSCGLLLPGQPRVALALLEADVPTFDN